MPTHFINTSSVAETVSETAVQPSQDLLQKSPSEFAALSSHEQQSLLDNYCSTGQRHMFSISLVREWTIHGKVK